MKIIAGLVLGVVAAMALAAANRTLSFGMMREALEGTMKTTAMIMLILIIANFLNFILASAGLADTLIGAIAAAELSPMQTSPKRCRKSTDPASAAFGSFIPARMKYMAAACRSLDAAFSGSRKPA